MPGKPSGMHTSSGISEEIRGIGFVGHGAASGGGAAAPVPTSRTRATAPTAPAIEVDRVAVMGRIIMRLMAVPTFAKAAAGRLSRREFGGALMAGLPLAALIRPVGL